MGAVTSESDRIKETELEKRRATRETGSRGRDTQVQRKQVNK